MEYAGRGWTNVDGSISLVNGNHNFINGVCALCDGFKETSGIGAYNNGRNEMIIYKYEGTDTEIYIPDMIGGYPVIAFEGNPFSSIEMTLLSVPSTVGRDSLKAIASAQASSLKKIIYRVNGDLATYTFTTDYNELETVVIENVTIIKQFAFNDSVDTMMQNLTKLIVNPNVVIEDMGVRNGNADLYSTGSYEETNITIGEGNVGLTGNIYYYSETQPTDTTHTYWHYVNGVATVWAIG